MKVVMYTAVDCIMCNATVKWMERHSIDYKTEDITNNSAMRERLTRETGGMQELPIVEIRNSHTGDIEYVSGFRPEELESKILAPVGAHK